MLHAVITTIQNPTPSVCRLVGKLSEIGGKLIVAGDSKGPQVYDAAGSEPWPVEFLSLGDQETSEFALAEKLPVNHYARKNLAYLKAIADGATCIYETDDDNTPNARWMPRSEVVEVTRSLPEGGPRWVNVYGYFTDALIWPRGLPLDQIRAEIPVADAEKRQVRSPVQQGLADGSPDVDAIWRLVMDRDFHFNPSPSIHLGAGNWCPFNTQSTWWWPLAYPLLYVPSFCTFRMCDIWKSFVAQRCLWVMGLGVIYHAAEVDQDRNPHHLMRDFCDEIPGYESNRRIAEILEALDLAPGPESVSSNLRLCYQALIEAGFLPEKEMLLVEAWLSDLADLQVDGSTGVG